MDPRNEYALRETRRYFFGQAALGIGGAALASLLESATPGRRGGGSEQAGTGAKRQPRGARQAALSAPGQAGDLPVDERGAVAVGPLRLQAEDGGTFDKDLPDSIRQGQRLTTMSSGQARFPIAPSIYKFAQHGKTRAWVSELLPHTAQVVDDLTIVKTMFTEAINHDPAVTFLLTGSQVAGAAELGRLGFLRAGRDERESAELRRAPLAVERPNAMPRPFSTGSGAPVSCRPSIRE